MMPKTCSAVRSPAAGSSTCPPAVAVPATWAMIDPMYSAAAVAMNQIASRVEISTGGASLVISDRPTGLRKSSPVVCSR